MKKNESKTAARRVMRVAGELCLLAIICVIASNTACAQDLDYTDCIPYGVSADGWQVADNVSIRMLEFPASDGSDTTYGIDIIPYCLFRENQNEECEIIICNISLNSNVPGATQSSGPDPTGIVADLADSLNVIDTFSLGYIIGHLILQIEEDIISRTINYMVNTIDMCGMKLDSLNECGDGEKKVAYQVFNASCRSAFHFNGEYPHNGKLVSLPCPGSGHGKYKYEYCYEYDANGGKQAIMTRTKAEDYSSGCSEEYILSEHKHLKCYPKTCFPDKKFKLNSAKDLIPYAKHRPSTGDVDRIKELFNAHIGR